MIPLYAKPTMVPVALDVEHNSCGVCGGPGVPPKLNPLGLCVPMTTTTPVLY